MPYFYLLFSNFAKIYLDLIIGYRLQYFLLLFLLYSIICYSYQNSYLKKIKGNSQHMIAKVLGISQPAVSGAD